MEVFSGSRLFLLCLGLLLGPAAADSGLLVATTDEESMTDASDVTFAHAVNSRDSLERELAGDVRFLEADVSLGSVAGGDSGHSIPIMAHPPDVTSDISLERWLDIVIARKTGKGIKLDFKSVSIVEPSLKILQRHKEKLTFPLWLNADILPGPVNSTTVPVPAEIFLSLCRQYFPAATLSLGWTTYWFFTFPQNTLHYGWDHVRSMADTLRCADVSDSPITFPVRGVFVTNSLPQLRWLAEVFPQSTFTVWSGKYDTLELTDLMLLRAAFPKWRVFYDIPEPLSKVFTSKKNDIEGKIEKPPTFFDHNWMEINKKMLVNSSCDSHTYVTESSVLFGKDVVSAVLLKDTFHIDEGKTLEAKGRVTFFPSIGVSSNQDRNHQLILVLPEVSSFSKNFSDSATDDTDVAWTAMESSQLHVFSFDGSSAASSCHYFHLNTAADKLFQAWTIPCDSYESLTPDNPELLASGRSEVSRRKKLVLPRGPLMFGLMSSGNNHVVVHDLEVKGHTAISSGGQTTSISSMTATLLILILMCFVLGL